MVQHVIESLLRTGIRRGWIQPKRAVILTLAGSEQAQSGNKVWLLLPRADSIQLSSLGLDVLREVGLVIGVSLSQ